MATKILAIDWGKKRIGLAISDESKTIATPLPTLTVNSLKGVLFKIRKIIDKEKVSTIVLGYPKNIDGTLSNSSEKAKAFGEKLISVYSFRKRQPRLVLVDERLSSWEAKQILRERKERIDKGSGRIDQIVAALILQNYLDKRKVILAEIEKRNQANLSEENDEEV